MAKQKKVNRKAQFSQTTCVFCNGKPLTDEHVFSDWIKTIVPRTDEPKHYQYLTNATNVGGNAFVITPAIKFKQGPYGNRRVKIVCNECNSGWMNQIEQQARPILTALILGENYIIQQQDQLSLANWALLKTIIAEYTDVPNKTIRAHERKEFYELRRPFGNWRIFIGRFVNNSTPDLKYIHAGAIANLIYPVRSLDPVKHMVIPINDSPNTQFSIFVIGQLLFYTFKSALEDQEFYFKDPIGNLLHQIYPRKYDQIDWGKIVTLAQNDIQRLRLNHIKFMNP